MLRKIGTVDYEIWMPDKTKKKGIFHVNSLKEWKEREALWGEVRDEEFGPEASDYLREGQKIELSDELDERQKQQLVELELQFQEVFSGLPLSLIHI